MEADEVPEIVPLKEVPIPDDPVDTDEIAEELTDADEAADIVPVVALEDVTVFEEVNGAVKPEEIADEMTEADEAVELKEDCTLDDTKELDDIAEELMAT